MSGQDEARQLRRRACCLTGHRVLPSDPDERMELTHNLRKTVARLAQEGIQVFYTGGALGFDTLAAVTVLELKAQFPQIQLYLAVPYPACTSRLRSMPTGCISSARSMRVAV